MIENLPTAEGLNGTALRLYVRAWMGIIGLMHAFDSDYPADEVFDASADDEWKEERADYLEMIQEELQALLALVQQCNELALKARICGVSPYLLLLNGEMKFASSSKPIDFSDLRTLDAVDLPGAVNTLCPDLLPHSYIEAYGRMRRERNRYTHLGVSSGALDPRKMLIEMIDLYLALWPERAWLTDRVDFATVGSSAFFEDKNFSPRLEAMYEMSYIRAVIPPARWKKLFGVKRSDVRYLCPACADDWAVRRLGQWKGGGERTAHYISAGKVMHCLMCSGDFEAEAQPCGQDGCNSQFIVSEVDTEHGGKCYSCGTDRIREDAGDEHAGFGVAVLDVPNALDPEPRWRDSQ